MITAKVVVGGDAAVARSGVHYDKGDNRFVSYQFDFSSNTSSGVCGVECSNTGVKFVSIPALNVSVAAGESAVINASNACYRYTRPAWTPTAGTGTVDVTLFILEPRS